MSKTAPELVTTEDIRDAGLLKEEEASHIKLESKLAANERKQSIDKMSTTNEEGGGDTRPSFLVGDQDDPESPDMLNSAANLEEDRDHFNQNNCSQKPSGFDLAEKRRRLR